MFTNVWDFKRPLIGSEAWSTKQYHFRTLEVVHLLRPFSNAISRTVMQQFTRFQLTQSVARSLYDSLKPNSITLFWSQTGPMLVADLSQTC